MAEPLTLHPRQRRLAFSALIMATVIAVLDISAVNLALPIIAADLHLPISQALWLSKANLLACAVAILPCSALGDVIGHRRCLFSGLAILGLASLGCALSSDLWLLITLRAVQGCAGAAIMCSTLVLLREIYGPKQLGMALGLNALFVAVTTTSAPAISGLILSYASWRWLFVIAPALALAALVLGRTRVPEKRQRGAGFDALGSVLLVAIALLGLAHYLQWLPAMALLALLPLGGVFIWQQRHSLCPLLPLQLFANARFDYSLACSTLAFVGQSAVFIALPITLQQGLGYDPLMTALLFLPWPLTTALVGPWAGRQADRRQPRLVACAGLVLLASGLALLAAVPASAPAWHLIVATMLCGAGFGLFQSPNNREILTNAGTGHTARASALLSASRLLGQALGALLVGVFLADAAQTSDAGQFDPRVAQMFGWCAALQVATLVVGALLYRAKPQEA